MNSSVNVVHSACIGCPGGAGVRTAHVVVRAHPVRVWCAHRVSLYCQGIVMKPLEFRKFSSLLAAMALPVLLAACNPNIAIFRFQLVNQTPYSMTEFRVAASEAALASAPNHIDSPLPPNDAADADVPGTGQYWLRATADVDGVPTTVTRGPVTMSGGTAGWSWYMNEGEIVEGTTSAHLYARSNLPVVVIDTGVTPIPDEPKIDATMYIIDNQDGTPNRPALEDAQFSTPIGIERRGNSTQTFPKASWSLELRDEAGDGVDAELLGMPAEEDWILYGPWMDRSLVRNVVGYGVWADLGYYAPRTRFCEVYLVDERGETPVNAYEGVYVMTERIKRDGDRVDITRLEPEDIEEPAISGGYLLEIMLPSRLDDDEVGLPVAGGFVASLVYPKPEDILPVQQAWIQEYLHDFELALFGRRFADPEAGYAAYIDVPSFIDYMLLQEYFKNRDAFHSSTFLYKDREGLLRMGPIWDLNIAMGYFSFQGLEGTADWLLNKEGGPIERSPWTARLLEDPAFRAQYIARWQELRQGILSTREMNARIDAAAAELDTAQVRQFVRWPSLGMTLLPDLRFLMFAGPHPESYQGELLYMKNWLQERGTWMDGNLGSL